VKAWEICNSVKQKEREYQFQHKTISIGEFETDFRQKMKNK